LRQAGLEPVSEDYDSSQMEGEDDDDDYEEDS
jgi:hypothetical protein